MDERSPRGEEEPPPRPPESHEDRGSEDRGESLHRELARFPASLFQFDERMRDGWLTDRYFTRAIGTLEHANRDPVVTMQLFGKVEGVIAGLYECVRMLQTQLTRGYAHEELEVWTLLEGDRVVPWEVCLRITGKYRAFAHLETPLDGVLSRRSLIATNVDRAVQAAGGTPVVYFGPRRDDWRIQTPDGYAARVGGGESVSSDAGAAWWGGEGVGTVPHALIAAFGGDVVEATLAFARYVRAREPDVPVVSLVDYDNDCVGDAVAVARAMEEAFGPGVLEAVRLDTSSKLIDRSLIGEPGLWGREDLTGVNPHLVRRVRKALDEAGFASVGIFVSGGFGPAKIRRFEEEDLPIAGYGVGSSLLGHGRPEEGVVSGFDITADVVELEGRPQAKVGRWLWDNPRLVRVDWKRLAELDELERTGGESGR
ncbi:MAG: quinolinate phosphoribosyl transferase [Gemmatimonadota bacterium]|nr:quinolinate phosphoribosyl transferase [Gemmatimonadota bacterium]